jgi:glycine/D-amino acid oxidase-like deaminating enzyme
MGVKTADAVIIGAGVIGSSIAFRLAEQGRKVVLVDKAGPGAGASGSCDKAIFLQSKRPGLHMELALASRRLYDTLEAELDADLELKNDGGMVAIETPEHLDFMRDFVRKQQDAGISVELLEGDEARTRQPCLSPHVLGASFSPDDAEVNPLALNTALFRAAVRHGAESLTHCEVTGIRASAGRVTGVETRQGSISTPLVVNAAGPFAGQVGQLAGVHVPVKPRRGTILISEAVGPMVNGSMLCAQYIAAKHLAAVGSAHVPRYGIGLSLGQTDSGNLLIGGSREFAGFDKAGGPEIMAAIAQHAIRIVPALANIRIIRSMSGFRPYTGDGLPIIDRAPGLDGYVIAAGHEGDGIALAPITGILVRDLLDGEASPFLHALTVNRFTAPIPA